MDIEHLSLLCSTCTDLYLLRLQYMMRLAVWQNHCNTSLLLPGLTEACTTTATNILASLKLFKLPALARALTQYCTHVIVSTLCLAVHNMMHSALFAFSNAQHIVLGMFAHSHTLNSRWCNINLYQTVLQRSITANSCCALQDSPG